MNVYYFPSIPNKEFNISEEELSKLIINHINDNFYLKQEKENPIIEKIIKYFN